MSVIRGSAEIYRQVVPDLPTVEQAARKRMRALAMTAETHSTLQAATPAFRLVEAGGKATVAKAESLRVAYWNAQRFQHFDACCDLIRSVRADVVLLGELDVGMARSG